MTIPVPTIDQFNETTVMTVIRNVVDYIIGLVPQINNGDVSDMTVTYQGSTLTISLVKGDGNTISKNVQIQSGTSNPYPTDVALSLAGTILNCDIMLSDNNHVTGSVDLSPLVPSVTGFVTEDELQQVQSDLQEQITGLKLSTSNNNMTLNGDSVQIVKTVSGTVSNGNLQITVNGVSSGDIPLPESGYGSIELSTQFEETRIYRSTLNVPGGHLLHFAKEGIDNGVIDNNLNKIFKIDGEIFSILPNNDNIPSHYYTGILINGIDTLVENSIKKIYTELGIIGKINFGVYLFNTTTHIDGLIYSSDTYYYASYDGTNFELADTNMAISIYDLYKISVILEVSIDKFFVN